MLPAARRNDWHTCPAHVGGMVCAPNAARVDTNSVPQARGGDPAICVGALDFIVTGSGTVTVGSKPAARATDKTMHKGAIQVGSGNVMIGGPTVGAIVGNPDAARKACEAAAAGRASGSTAQSYNNCGIETSRQIINKATGKNISEDELLKKAIRRKQASGSLDNLPKAGGSWPNQREPLLNENGVPAEQVPGNMDNLAQATAEGKGVQVDIWAGTIWPPSYGYKPGTGAHVVMVTGVEYDADGNMKNVIVNDTGAGDCGKSYPAALFKSALMGDNHVITKRPVW